MQRSPGPIQLRFGAAFHKMDRQPVAFGGDGPERSVLKRVGGMGRQAAFESGAGALAEHGPHRREILRSQSEAFDEVMVVDGAFPLQRKSRGAVADVADGRHAVAEHPAVPVGGRGRPFLGRGLPPLRRDRVGERGQSAAPRDPAFQIAQFQVAVRVDEARNQGSVIELHVLLRIDPVRPFDAQQASLSVEREYPVLQPALRSQDQVRR